MISPRLGTAAILATAKLCDASLVSLTDPRFRGADMTMLWMAAVIMPTILPPGSPMVHVIEWPDMSLGVAYLPSHEIERAIELLAAYDVARQALERTVLESATFSGCEAVQ